MGGATSKRKNKQKNKTRENPNTRTASPIYRGHGNSHRLAQDGCSCVGGAQCTVRESSDCGPNSKRPGDYLAVTFPGGVHRRARLKYSHMERHAIGQENSADANRPSSGRPRFLDRDPARLFMGKARARKDTHKKKQKKQHTHGGQTHDRKQLRPSLVIAPFDDSAPAETFRLLLCSRALPLPPTTPSKKKKSPLYCAMYQLES